MRRRHGPGHTRGPALRAVKTFKSVSYIISYAPEGTTSQCKICRQGFHAGRLRFGNVYETGDSSIIMRWHHLRCIRPPASMERMEQLSGLQEIRGEDIAVVQIWLNPDTTTPRDPDRASRAERRSHDSGQRKLVKAESTPDPLIRPPAALRSRHRLQTTLQRSGSSTVTETAGRRDMAWLERGPVLEWLPENNGLSSIRKGYEKSVTFRKVVAKPNRHNRFKTV